MVFLSSMTALQAVYAFVLGFRLLLGSAHGLERGSIHVHIIRAFRFRVYDFGIVRAF